MDTILLNGGDWQFKGFVGEDWLLRNSHLADTRDVRGWNKAVVPGTVQNDLWQAGLIPDPYFERNSLLIEWAADRTWVYKKTFTVDPALRGSRIQLVFQGVDYAARFYLNDELLGRNTGMFLPAEFEVADRLNYDVPNRLVVVIDPAPFEQPQIGYTSQVYTQKARMNYWWDFCPRMVHLGIWQDILLRVTGPVRIEDVYVRPQLAPDLKSAQLTTAVRLDTSVETQISLEVLLRKSGESATLQQATASLTSGQVEAAVHFDLSDPVLWWPNGAGEQALYEVDVRVLADGLPSDTRKVTTAFRQIDFILTEGAAEDALPYNLVVNGRKIYITGWNWVPMDVMYGVEQPEKRMRLLQLARNANVNLLRVWGGGLIENEEFYNLCDRLGILVWQEFIQSSSGIDNVPSEEPKFIEFIIQNAEQAIRARRNHPALAVWCGGNELHYTPNNLCDERHPTLAALRETVERLDPGRHWVPTSPAGGVFSYAAPDSAEAAQQLQDVHGPWEYQGLLGQYNLYNLGRSMLHSEFGVEGLTNLRTLNRTIAPVQQWPVSLDNPIWEHLASWWVKQPVWQEVFGTFKDVAATQRATQFMQADGLRYAVEADRRRMYQNGGTMPWQFNEPYPMAACTSAVDYYAEPKPVYYTVARAYQPFALSARFKTLAWGAESSFEAEVWAANSGAERAGDLIVRVLGMNGRPVMDIHTAVTCPANQAQALYQVNLPLEKIPGSLFFLHLALQDPSKRTVAVNRYLFSKTENLAVLLQDLPAAALNSSVDKLGDRWNITLQNPSDQTALWVWLESEKPDLRAPNYAYFADSYFSLLPGEQRTVPVAWSAAPEPDRKIIVTGWNFPAHLIQ